MVEALTTEDLLDLEEVEREYGIKRSTLYRYVHKGRLLTYRRGMDKRVYVRRSDIESVRRFRPVGHREGIPLEAIERAEALQRRIFGDRVLTTPSSELIEEGR